jgi:hypothetical protein
VKCPQQELYFSFLSETAVGGKMIRQLMHIAFDILAEERTLPFQGRMIF